MMDAAAKYAVSSTLNKRRWYTEQENPDTWFKRMLAKYLICAASKQISHHLVFMKLVSIHELTVPVVW